MTDTLRTRIAAVLLGDHCVQGMTAPCDDCRAHALRQADAVIRELNLDISHYYKTSQGREVCIEGFWTEEATDDR